MAKPIETLSIQLKFTDAGSQAVIERIRGSLKKLELGASGAIPSINRLRDEIQAQANASVNSVSNIKAQRAALMALRDEAKIGGHTFKQLTEDVKKLDAQLAKTQGRKPGGGGRALAATQMAGAVVSGGIFGGPEGALGALGGAALGGVPGAFAGAAIGAQVGGMRQTLGEFADYAATIEKLKIALNGVLKNQDEFNAAIQAARLATEELNIPQAQAIRGITRLSAAVKGAKGPAQDATTVFRNVTAAIKATGGSSEDVQGAITAMVQVFSKGKVSAEELSGQLGERLPGAVTMFAKANNMTLPQLQKNLKAGTVGLNELMNFIVELGNTYDGTARKISDSNADAGARLAVAVQNMRAQIGAELVPIGAEFQAAFADFIEKITPFLVRTLPEIGRLFLELGKHIDTMAVAATAGLAAFSIAKLIAIIAQFGSLTAAVVKLKTALIALNLVNPYTALAAGAALLAGAIFNANQEQARFNKLVREGSVAQVESNLRTKQLELDKALAKRLSLVGDPTEQAYGAEQAFLDGRIAKLRDEILLLKERKRTAIIDRDQGADLSSSLLPRGDYKNPVDVEDKKDPKGGKSRSGDAAANALQRRRDAAIELTRRLRDALVLSQAQGEVEKLLAQQSKQRNDLQARFAKLQKDGVDAEIEKQQKEAESLLLQKQRVDLTVQTNKLGQRTVDDITKITEQIKQKFQSDQEYKRLLAEGITPELAQQLVAINQQFAAGDKLLKQRILDFQAQLAKSDLSEQETESIREQIRLLEEKRKILGDTANKAAEEAKKYKEETSNFKTFKDTFKAGIEEMGNLYENLGSAAASAFSGMADIVADFVDTGKANFKDFASSVLKDLSRIFIRMAFFQVFKSLGLFGDGGVVTGGAVIGQGTTPPVTLPGSVGAIAANGLALGKNGIMPFAKGGIVTKPTLFRYADGGSGRFGLMGEAGPEAIMPLRRGRNGKLGVEASGDIGNVVVNVDASGSKVQGSQPNAKALGSAIGAAVQAELIKQKRPGGLLS